MTIAIQILAAYSLYLLFRLMRDSFSWESFSWGWIGGCVCMALLNWIDRVSA